VKTRFTLFALAALTTLSISALAPTRASAWGMHGGGYGGHGWGGISHCSGGHGRNYGGGYGGNYGGGYSSNYGGGYSGNYRTGETAEAPRSYYRPSYATRQAYAQPQQPYEVESSGESQTPEQQPNQDRRPANYSSRELQK
jgi:hypothetical protein